MTYHQAQEKGYQVRKGEKSTTIFFTKPYEIDDDRAEDGKKSCGGVPVVDTDHCEAFRRLCVLFHTEP